MLVCGWGGGGGGGGTVNSKWTAFIKSSLSCNGLSECSTLQSTSTHSQARSFRASGYHLSLTAHPPTAVRCISGGSVSLFNLQNKRSRGSNGRQSVQWTTRFQLHLPEPRPPSRQVHPLLSNLHLQVFIHILFVKLLFYYFTLNRSTFRLMGDSTGCPLLLLTCNLAGKRKAPCPRMETKRRCHSTGPETLALQLDT